MLSSNSKAATWISGSGAATNESFAWGSIPGGKLFFSHGKGAAQYRGKLCDQKGE